MKQLSEEQQNLLAHKIAGELHDSLVKSAEERYMHEINSYRNIQFAVEDSMNIIFSAVYKDV